MQGRGQVGGPHQVSHENREIKSLETIQQDRPNDINHIEQSRVEVSFSPPLEQKEFSFPSKEIVKGRMDPEENRVAVPFQERRK
jgi:hypothetical protein